MPTADSNVLSELLTRLYETPFLNLVAQDNFIYTWLPKKGMRDTKVLWKVRYAGNTSAGSYGENDDLGTAGHQFFKPAEITVRQVKALVQLSGLIIEATKGDGGYMEAWTDEINNGMEDLKTVHSDMMLAQTAPGNAGKDVDGLPWIIDDTGIYANIDSGTYPWWRAYINENVPANRNQTIALLQNMLMNLRPRPRKAKTSVIFCDENQFNNYGNLLTGLRRYKAMEDMDAHFSDTALDFAGIPVQHVDAYPVERMDFVDRRHWEYRTLLPFKSEPADAGNVDARRQFFKHYGNIVCKNRYTQGSLQDLNSVSV